MKKIILTILLFFSFNSCAFSENVKISAQSIEALKKIENFESSDPKVILKKLKEFPFDVKKAMLDKLVGANVQTNNVDIDYTILILNDYPEAWLVDKKTTAEFLAKINKANYEYFTQRMKNPKFDPYFEKNVINNEEYTKKYDELAKNNFDLSKYNNLSQKEKQNMLEFCSVLLGGEEKWGYEEITGEDLEKHWEIMTLYLKRITPRMTDNGELDENMFHAFYQKDPITNKQIKIKALKNPPNDFLSYVLQEYKVIDYKGLYQKLNRVDTNIAYEFVKKKLQDRNSDLDAITYFIKNTEINKEISPEMEELIDKGYYSYKYQFYEAKLSKLEKQSKKRKEIIDLLENNEDINIQDKSEILTYWQKYKYDKKFIEKTLENPEIKDKKDVIYKRLTNGKIRPMAVVDCVSGMVLAPIHLAKDIIEIPVVIFQLGQIFHTVLTE